MPGSRLFMVTLRLTVWRDRPAVKPTSPERAPLDRPSSAYAIFALATAAWMRYALGTSYALRDPREEEIGRALHGSPLTADAVSSALTDLPGLFPTRLKADPEWRREVAMQLNRLLV